MSPSLNSIVQLHATLSLLFAGAIVNLFPFNVHVALLLFVTLGVIVSQPHACAPKSLTTLFTILFHVITHKLLLVAFNVNATSVHVNVTFLDVVAFINASLTCTATVCVHVPFLYKLYVVLHPYVPHHPYAAVVCNHTHVSFAALISAIHVLHSATLTFSILYVGAVRSILFTTALPLYVVFPFPSTALKHTYVPLSLSASNLNCVHAV